ncbi:MAG: glycosyltransferase, partial [Oscillospiraceae bacterium]
MKILHLLKSTDYSGAENVVISIMQHCTENNMVYASPNGSIKKIVQENNLTFYTLKAVNIRSIRQAIKEIKPDIIHAHDFSMSTLAAFSTHKIPIIAHLHNN